ncbi:hypothetical protein ACU61A_32040 [Pseudonocardia sichuanensis]
MEAAFLFAPLVMRLATEVPDTATGVRQVAVVVAATTAVGAVLLTGVLLLGGSRPQAPDLRRWVDGDGPAYRSPPVAALLRRRDGRPVADHDRS